MTLSLQLISFPYHFVLLGLAAQGRFLLVAVLCFPCLTFCSTDPAYSLIDVFESLLALPSTPLTHYFLAAILKANDYISRLITTLRTKLGTHNAPPKKVLSCPLSATSLVLTIVFTEDRQAARPRRRCADLHLLIAP